MKEGKEKIRPGFHFEKFEVIAPTEKRLNGYMVWRCRCDCGNEIVVLQNDLNRGKKKSFGCLQKQMGKKNLRLRNGTSVTKLETLAKKPMSSNISGSTGIYKIRRTRKWGAQTFSGLVLRSIYY